MKLNAYLLFNGTCDEAFKFYEKCLEGKIIAISRFSDAPAEMQLAPEEAGKVMNVQLLVGDQMLMGSDAPSAHYDGQPNGFSVAINTENPDEAEKVYAALSEGGEVTMPIQETFWAQRFAMFNDKYGTPWMINYMKPMG